MDVEINVQHNKLLTHLGCHCLIAVRSLQLLSSHSLLKSANKYMKYMIVRQLVSINFNMNAVKTRVRSEKLIRSDFEARKLFRNKTEERIYVDNVLDKWLIIAQNNK